LAADVFQNQVTITNRTGADVDNLVYRRVMDWDVPPTEFNEYVTHVGVKSNLVSNGGNVAYAGDDGFATSNPLGTPNVIVEGTTNTDFEKAGPDDHGSVFDFSFGTLKAGESRIFNIYYGSAPDKAQAVAKLTSLGADVYSLGQPDVDDTDAVPTFLFGFGGVGGVELGTSAEDPVLPFTPAEGVFSFDAPIPRRWFDPPMAEGFTISLTDGEFYTVEAPAGFNDMVLLAADGTVLDADFDGGETFTFSAGVHTFIIKGVSLDTASPSFATALPLYLDFTPGAKSMTWTAITASPAAVPEPEAYGLVLAGLGVLAFMQRFRRPRA
jgi:hypothetical protein